MIIKAKIVLFIFCTGSGEYYIFIVSIFFIECIPVSRTSWQPEEVQREGDLLCFYVAANPKKTKLGLSEVEYVGHVVSSEGTSFTDEKRLKVLDFPLPDTHRGLLMFIGLANYFRDHVPNITEMLKPLGDMILVAKGANLSKKLIWTEERIDHKNLTYINKTPVEMETIPTRI